MMFPKRNRCAKGQASVAGQFKSLGLSPDMAAKFVPVLTKFVGSKGGASVGSLLAGVLK
jgi:predicted anti-sigma-YlaC factor YlaD